MPFVLLIIVLVVLTYLVITYWWVILLAALVGWALWYFFIRNDTTISAEERIRWEREASAEEKKRWEVDRVQLALTCHRCGGLAEPIQGTGNRYRCNCGKQFAGARHGW